MKKIKRPIIALGFCLTIALSSCGADFFSALAGGLTGVEDKSESKDSTDSSKSDSSTSSDNSNSSTSSDNSNSSNSSDNSSNTSSSSSSDSSSTGNTTNSNTSTVTPVDSSTSPSVKPGTIFNEPAPAGTAATQPAPSFIANFVPPGHQYFGPDDTGLNLGSGFAGTQMQANVGVLVTVDNNNKGRITLINTGTLKSFPTIRPGGAPLTFDTEVQNGRPFVPVFVREISLLRMTFDYRTAPGQCSYYELNYEANGQVYIATSSPSTNCFI